MVVTYCTATEVSELLQVETFSTTTSPTFNQVEAIINRKEAKIDQKLAHGWREKTVTDLYLDLSFIELNNGVRFDLSHYSIRDLTKLEVWDGSNNVDFLTDKVEGRDKDYWVDKTLGLLWVRTGVHTSTRKPIRVSFTYGETVVEEDIKDLCVHLTAIDVLNTYPAVVSFADDGNSQTNTQQQRIDNYKEIVKEIFNSRSSIDTI